MCALDLTPERLAAEAHDCPVFVTARTLAEWVGAGQAVTTRGVLKPAAAVEVCDLLGIEVPSRKPRSALDIDELMMVWAAASSAGFIKVFRGRVTAGPNLQRWLDGGPDVVLAIWTTCALEWLGLAGEGGEDGSEYLLALATLESQGGEASLANLTVAIGRLIGVTSPDCTCPECASLPRSQDEEETRDVVRALGDLGISVLHGDAVELTPLGGWLTDVMFRQSAPPADVDAETLVEALVQFPVVVSTLMARPWLSSRAPAEAASALLAVGEATFGPERLVALDLARECGPEAESVWREWAAKDGFGAYARAWLAEQDGSAPSDADAAWVTVDALATMVVGLPDDLPQQLLPAIVRAQAGGDLAEILPLMANSGHPGAPLIVKLLSGAADEPGPLPATAASPRPPLRRLGVAGAVPPPSDSGYQIKVHLRDVAEPPVWRRLRVPDLTLGQLHEVIQVAMGWDDCHMHAFSDGSNRYGRPDPELGHLDERTVRLSQVLTSVGDGLHYSYDFGDGWDHDVTLEKVLPADAAVTMSVCTEGQGACPPEDCGGAWGYEELKATLADSGAEQHADALEWLGLASGDAFDPNEFSTEKVDSGLRHVLGPR